MKTGKFSLLAFAAIAALTTACNNEELISNESPTEGTVITATAGAPTGGADTRLTYTDGSTKMDIVWAANDQFSAFNPEEYRTGNFIIKPEDAGKAVASFTTNKGFGVSGERLYALYPTTTAHDPLAIPLTLEGQTGILADLKNFNYMTASAQYIHPSPPEFAFGTFAHQVAIVKLVLTFPDGVTGDASNIGLSATGLSKSISLNLPTGAFSNAVAGDVTTGTNVIAIGADKTLTAYLCVFSGALTDAKAVATAGGKQYEVNLNDLTVVAGRMYTATATLTEKRSY